MALAVVDRIDAGFGAEVLTQSVMLSELTIPWDGWSPMSEAPPTSLV